MVMQYATVMLIEIYVQQDKETSVVFATLASWKSLAANNVDPELWSVILDSGNRFNSVSSSFSFSFSFAFPYLLHPVPFLDLGKNIASPDL